MLLLLDRIEGSLLFNLSCSARLPFRSAFSWLLPSVMSVAVLAGGCAAAAQRPPSDAEVNTFVDGLLRKMTLNEKIGQMEQVAGQPMFTPPAKQEQLIRDGEAGSFLFHTDPVRINELQRVAVTQSRLHIPLLFGYDVIHGFRTIFPIPLAMASSWDADLVTRAQAVAAKEARLAGVHWAFAPMVDIARDARWGRIMESAGEDPYLGETMAAAQVRGFQGDYVGQPDHVLTSVKHFAAYGAAFGGRDYDSVDVSDDLLYNVYLRPYRAGVKAGSATIMTAYMDLNSVPATGNQWLLQDVLRKDWGFQGFVVSDWDAVRNLETHGFAANAQDAAARAVNAGVNMEMTSSTYRDTLAKSVAAGTVSEKTIDNMVRPLLAAKYRLGLFTNPYVDVERYKRETLTPESRAIAREAAEKAAVLLRNEGQTLPLKKNTASIALIGPLADNKLDTMGSWAIHGNRNDTVTIAEGLREKFPNARIDVTTGVEIQRGSPTIFDEQVIPDKPVLDTDQARQTEFQHALDLVKAADVAVLVLGEAQTMNGENASRSSLSLPGGQERLLEAVAALGKPVVLVVMTGRPIDITWASGHVPAILNVWYPGTEGGHAVANLLAGDANPGGHLPVTWPRAAGQEPLFYNTNLTMDPGAVGRRYWDMPSAPLYPFGYGLSYSSFSVSDLKVPNSNVGTNGMLTATCVVKNASGVAGTEVVQLYTHQRAGSASRPTRELKAFRRVSLAPNESRTIEVTMPADALRYWSSSLRRWVLEPGTFDVWVGDSSAASLHSTFTLTAAK